MASHCGTVFASWWGAHPPWQMAAGGFFGVELFFVLSGFLIGRLLIDILDRDVTWRAWRVFLIRRWMRTLPLYFAWLLVLALVWPPRFWEPGHQALWHDLPWYVTLTQNLAWPMVDDAWFGVSWSLSVEEWFYLLFPSLLFGIALFGRKRLAFWCSVAAFFVVPAMLRWRLPAGVSWDHVTSAAVIYRLDAVAFGIAAAWLDARRAGILRHRVVLLLMGVVLIMMVWIGRLGNLLHASLHVQHTFIFDVVSLGFALCLPAAVAIRPRRRGWLAACARALSGQSYAIYMTHLTLLEMATFYRTRYHVAAPLAVLATVLATYGISLASWRWFERPILAWRPRQFEERAGGWRP